LSELKRNGFEIKGVGFFETTITKDFLSTQMWVAERKIGKVTAKHLRESLEKELRDLKYKVSKKKWGISFGSDYVICATLSNNTNPSHGATSLNLDNYKSPVQEQDVIFPIDDN
jgi:hypothetical protein